MKETSLFYLQKQTRLCLQMEHENRAQDSDL